MTHCPSTKAKLRVFLTTLTCSLSWLHLQAIAGIC